MVYPDVGRSVVTDSVEGVRQSPGGVGAGLLSLSAGGGQPPGQLRRRRGQSHCVFGMIHSERSPSICKPASAEIISDFPLL